MSKAELNVAQTLEMILHVSKGMISKTDFLTKADQQIGDGDHGIGMQRGFTAVHDKMSGQSFAKVEDVIKTVGITMMASVGGAAGAIFGTLFKGGAKNMGAFEKFDSKALTLMLVDGLDAIKKRGGANVGDKTMIDALEPASLKAKALEGKSLSESLKEVAEAARLGMEETKKFIATTGKAKTLGERSIGYSDPGSISMYFILDFMREYVTN